MTKPAINKFRVVHFTDETSVSAGIREFATLEAAVGFCRQAKNVYRIQKLELDANGEPLHWVRTGYNWTSVPDERDENWS